MTHGANIKAEEKVEDTYYEARDWTGESAC